MHKTNCTLIDAAINLRNKNYSRILDLSEEKSIDYNLLAIILKKTSFLETLVLPKLSDEEALASLSMLDDATAINTTLTQVKFKFQNSDDDRCMRLYQRILSRMQRNQKRIFAIHGGGNIGLGLMADIISQSPFDYRIVATSGDSFTNNLINSNHTCWLQLSGEGTHYLNTVKNLHMIYSREEENIIELYKQANLAAICLTEEGVLNTYKQIAQGLIARYQLDGAGLKILILMNKPNCDQFVRELITKAILTQTNDQALTNNLLSRILIIPTVVDRIVSKMNKKAVLTQLRLQLNNANLPLTSENAPADKQKKIENVLANTDQLKKAIQDFNLKPCLFNAEKNYALYVSDHFVESHRLPSMKAVRNANHFMIIKNKYINGPHAIIAWLGGLFGYSKLAEAIKNPMIAEYAYKLMEDEIAPILKTAYPEISDTELAELKHSFITRCQTNIEDTIHRVGRDPLRKLYTGGCIRGVIELRQKLNLAIPIPKLEYGIAAGILYAVKKIDPSNIECRKMLEIYRKCGSYQAILCYKGPYGTGTYPGFDPVKDRMLVRNILGRMLTLLSKQIRNNTHRANIAC